MFYRFVNFSQQLREWHDSPQQYLVPAHARVYKIKMSLVEIVS